jgi:ferredoxin
MSVSITSKCITCGSCVWECPNEAISPGSPRPVVDPQRCTECYGFFGESQCMVVCPAKAIDVTAEPIDDLARRFDALHPGLERQNTWIWARIPQSGG